MNYYLAIDEGTSSTRTLLFDENFNLIDSSQKEINMIYPKPGWVEQDADELYFKTEETMIEVVERNNISWNNIIGIGITNQRETIVAWDKNTGTPLTNAIVWQCRRTDELINRYPAEFWSEVKRKTGLVKDPYFSGSKIVWMIENVPEVKESYKNGNLKVGTIESWLTFKLTGHHVTDVSNASRTQLLNIHTLNWDDEILNTFGISKDILPEIVGTAIEKGFETKFGPKIYGMIGDQQSALFGQRSFEIGDAKCTYGTGAFVLMNSGVIPPKPHPGLLTSIGWKIGNEVIYSLEGSIFTVGAFFKWLKDIEIINNYNELEIYSKGIDNAGVYIVPALSGLGTPYWDSDARGLIIGLTRATKKENIIRAALESVAFSVRDVIDSMQEAVWTKIKKMNVDGGATKNKLLMEIQSDLLNAEIFVPDFQEITALGAAFMAAIGSKNLSINEIKNLQFSGIKIMPKDNEILEKNYYIWKEAVLRSKGWIKSTNISY
ncbi:glycerol kinase [Marinitoga hydrogenitolerans DSM 16785]|uniref:ATP:glycerol 3-phosphotransferase n=1 Tax=Marinitoga hydrogenitolerans (strain DSM 16785 / JCM 12826 / AT1271) TaxID=1122195 RepID=A0A1M4SES6_MARH1|nr:glycerol kinase GlpK [Marinitoga hydrogenitolerans]SHE30668.1 glycerol kinase [Marinitoga hydrogenitolerans DSM 16785]